MSKSTPLILIFFLAVSIEFGRAQDINSTADLFHRKGSNFSMGELNIYQDPGIDSLISRYILFNLRLNGMDGFRIQIYNSSDKNAREESGKARAEFMTAFPDIIAYPPTFEKPSYYKIRVGDYRTRIEGTKYLLMVRKVFPDAILVPDVINFPDLNIK
jgi:hypothetical protein